MQELIIKKHKNDLNLDLNLEITDLYIYANHITKTFEIKYNDEININLNLEKLFIKNFSKQYNFQSKKLFDNIIDVRIFEGGKEKKEPKSSKDEIFILFEIEDKFLK